MALTPGTRLGAYEITVPIGSGGMGEVYRALDTNLARHVAIKILPDLVAHDPERLARFEREARTLAALNHPHIAQIYGFEKADGVPAIVMELVEGPTLADRIARGPLELDEAIPIARQIAEALEAAHEQGIVHRDLKPANIKVRDDGTVKVLDFGLARLADPRDGAGRESPGDRPHLTASPTITSPALVTGAGVLLGTAAYMSPEQAKGRQADKRSDIWAFGCVLYEMLAGKRPFAASAAASSGDAADDVAETLAAVLRSEPDWTAIPRDTPSSLVALARRCLHKDRRQRVGDVAAALFVLREPLTTAVPTRTRLNVAGSVVLAALAVLLTSGAWWLFRPSPPPASVERLTIVLPDDQFLAASVNRALGISRDGETVAFVANRNLHVRRMAAFETQEVPIVLVSGYSAAYPTFSPDGKSLAFYSPTDRTLKTVAVSGGVAVTLCGAGRILGVSWGDSGIVFSDGGEGIKRIVPGGTPEVIAALQPDELGADPQILPDGDTLLFTLARPSQGQSTWDSARIVVQSLKSGQRTIVFEGGSDARYVATGHILYATGGVLFARAFDPRQPDRIGQPAAIVDGIRRGAGTGAVVDSLLPNAAQFALSDNGSLVYLAGSATQLSGRQQLVLTDRKGGVTLAKLPPGPYQFPRASPNPRANQIVYGTDDGKDASVWLYDLDGLTVPRKLTFSGHNRFPIWSDDGEWVAYQSDRDGESAIFRQRLDDPAGKAERLTTPEAGTSHAPEAWSGNTMLFSATKGREVSLQILSVRERMTTPFPGVRSSRWPQAAFSKDGRWVAYSVMSSSENRDTLYVEPFPPTGVKHQISALDAHFPVWNGNNELLWVDPTRGSSNGRVGFVSATVTTQPRFELARDWQEIKRDFNVTAGGIGRARTYDILPGGQRFVGLADEGTLANGNAVYQRIQVVINLFEELNNAREIR
jgi:serine/threonine-protein kinase